MRPRTFRQLPQAVTGYPLDDVWSVIVPIARTNLVTNPSLETNTTNWTAIGGSIARSTTWQYHGAYSLAITPTVATTDGARFDTVSLSSGQIYAYSAKVKGIAGLKYKLCLETTGGAELSSVTFTANGRGQWVYGYYVETSTTTRRVTVRKAGHTSVAVFYIDGVQVEAINAGETVSTYLDGAQIGLVPNQFPAPYLWNGTPHGSTSARSGLTRAGGMVVKFSRYGFLLTAMIGLGLAIAQNVATEYARIDGGYDDYTRKPTGQITLQGLFQGRTYSQLRDNRSNLAQLFDRDLVGQDQRLILRHHLEDPNGNVLSNEVLIRAKYAGGLGGNTDNQFSESAPISFTLYLPGVQADGESGAALNVQLSIATGANGILQRSAAGVWSAMGTGLTAGTKAISIVRGTDGAIYLGGDFSAAGGVANTNGIAKWDPSAGSYSALGTGVAGGLVYQIAVMPNGDLIVGGTFTSAGGVANTNKIARWSFASQAWQSISSAFVGTEIRTVAVNAAGMVYVGGVFTSIGGVAATNVTTYNGTVWAAAGAGIAAGGVTSLVTTGTTVYAAVENTNVQRFTAGAWSNIGTVTGDPSSLAIDSRGFLYAAGTFTAIGGVTASNIAFYNGVSWQPLGTGLSGGGVNLRALFFDQQGLLYIGGAFTSAGGIATPSGAAVWNGSAFVYPDIGPNGGALTTFSALAITNGILYIGTSNNGSAFAGATTTITNTGTARSYPTITINGPTSGTARIYQITNPTTGRNIYLNLTISAGEVITMVFQPDGLSFTSTFQGNIASAILPGSNTADFFLSPGVNAIAFFSASNTVVATLSFRPVYLSLDDVP